MKKLTLKIESSLKSNYEEVYIEIYNPNDIDMSNEYNYEDSNDETVYFEKNNNIRKAQRKAFLNQ
ncbi:hypothetical protein [Arcobacter sp. YIC-310]|uniref:hypothetical protein n=1 Tax=Arcobacter sp. YIC-310 TaxID=3376632 RepID=UPI003C13B8E3